MNRKDMNSSDTNDTKNAYPRRVQRSCQRWGTVQSGSFGRRLGGRRGRGGPSFGSHRLRRVVHILPGRLGNVEREKTLTYHRTQVKGTEETKTNVDIYIYSRMITGQSG